MTAASLIVDRDGAIRTWSAEAVTLFGHDTSRAIGSLIELIIPEEERAAHWAGFRAAMTSGVLHYGPDEPIEAEAVTASGARIPVAITLMPERDVSGRIILLYVTVRPT